MLEQLSGFPPLYRDLAVVGAELFIAALGLIVLRLIFGIVFRRIARSSPAGKNRALFATILRNVTALLVVVFVLLLVAIGAINGWLVYRGSGIYAATAASLNRIPPGFWAA
ncbi:MAG TPA: hypothetical protein VF551_03015, partial [Chthoniobacterales bacterium]